MFFVPVNDDEKVIASVKVIVFPERETGEVATLMLHWLFCKVPTDPGVS